MDSAANPRGKSSCNPCRQRSSAAASGAHCTLRARTETVDGNRRKTLQILLDLAADPGMDECWGDGHAMGLLRSQSSPDELREAGASADTISAIFEDADA